jgi:hypothetical protein
VAVNNSIKVGPLVFLLQMFVITENIMKRPVLFLGASVSAVTIDVLVYWSILALFNGAFSTEQLVGLHYVVSNGRIIF